MSDWEGNPDRNCGEHRTTGARAWCFDCSEWCYPNILCHGCIDFRTLLAPIDNALRNGSYMTKANLALELLCEQVGVDRDGLAAVFARMKEAK